MKYTKQSENVCHPKHYINLFFNKMYLYRVEKRRIVLFLLWIADKIEAFNTCGLP